MLDTKEIEELRVAFGRIQKKRGSYKKREIKDFICSRCGEAFQRTRVNGEPICRSCRYKIERKDSRSMEMRRLHVEEGKTLQEVGDMYGITRERVRQLVGTLGHGLPAAYKKSIIDAHPELTNNELSAIVGISVSRGDQHHAIAGGALKRGVEIEDVVSRKLTELGIAHEMMPVRNAFDILLSNGRRIDVKASFRKMSPPSQFGSYYSFATRKAKRGDYCDFFILVIVPTMDMFVVPNEAVKSKCEQIHMDWPAHARSSKFHKYLNRFDLLEGE